MEDNQMNSPVNSLLNNQSKDNHFRSQLKTIFEYLQKNIATASMLTDKTGIPQKCITRYKRDLEKSGRLWEIEKKNCEKTGFKAWYLTTNPEYFIISNQLELFTLKTVNHGN